MEYLEKLIAFLNSYPVWAKYSIFGGLVFVCSILTFAPRNQGVPEGRDLLARPAHFRTKFIKIEKVKLFPPDPDAQVQIYAIVNGVRYRHPAIAGVDWIHVGPNMDQKTIELPEAERYEIRFEIVVHDGKKSAGAGTVIEGVPDMTSNMIRYIMDLPFSEEYKLYAVNGNVRGAEVGATVSYSIFEE